MSARLAKIQEAEFFRRSCALASCAGSALFAVVTLVGASAEAEPLATWILASNAQAEPVQAPASKIDGIASGALSFGSGVTAGAKANSFGGSSFADASGPQSAMDGGNFLEIAFSTAGFCRVSPEWLSCAMERSTTGPTTFQWMCQTNGGAFFALSEAFSWSGGSTNAVLPLSPLGTLPGEGGATFRLVAWDASAARGTLYFLSQIQLGGAYENVGAAPLSLGAIADREAVAGQTLSVPLAISGGAGAGGMTNAAASKPVAGRFGVEGGVFTYEPAEGDVALSPVVFTIAISDGEETASQAFSVEVLEYAWFTETFEEASKVSYAAGDATTSLAVWHGTNFVVKTPADGDHHNGQRSLKMQGRAAFVEMATDKTNGVGAVTLSHGVNRGKNANGASWRLFVSTDHGASWNAWASDPVASSNDFRKTTFAGIDLPGRVRIRLEYEATAIDKPLCVDDIRITDFGPAEEPDAPPEPPAALAIRAGQTLRECFDSMAPEPQASLPPPWRLAFTNAIGGSVMPYADGASATTQYGGTNCAILTAGFYNLGDGDKAAAADRAVGFLSSDRNYRTCALMVPVRNAGASVLASFRVAYSVEKYRTGTAKTIELCVSEDGENWTRAADGFLTLSPADEGAPAWVGEVPPPVRVAGRFRHSLEPGATMFLAWVYRSASAEEAGSAQVLAIDDIAIRAGDRMVFSVH